MPGELAQDATNGAFRNAMNLVLAANPQQAMEWLNDETFPKLMSLMIQGYAAKMAESGPDGTPSPVMKGQITATEAAIFVDRLLQMVDLELFEIQMWRSLGSGY
ncbi:hypothetical protein JZ785_10340 [Alicyclobacillus curvatus]|nr:hypothetical protein JZ785_10340 [Alicyclobacillus curvatus]